MLKQRRIQLWRLTILSCTIKESIRSSYAYVVDIGTQHQQSVSSSSSSSSSVLFAFQTTTCCSTNRPKRKRQQKHEQQQHQRQQHNQKTLYPITKSISSCRRKNDIYNTNSCSSSLARYTLMNINHDVIDTITDDSTADISTDYSTSTTQSSRQIPDDENQQQQQEQEQEQDQQQQQFFASSTVPIPHFLDESSLTALNGKINSFDFTKSLQSNLALYPLRQLFPNDDDNDNDDAVNNNGPTVDSYSKVVVINDDTIGNSRVTVNKEGTKSSTSSSDGGGTTTTTTSTSTSLVTVRSLWRRRDARSAEEGIRREKIITSTKLSDVLDKARGSMMEIQNKRITASRKFVARTITGFINALAENVDGLDVQVTANPNSPFWKKHVDVIAIQFSKLGFKPLQISGGVFEPSQVAHHYQARSLLGIYDDFVAKRIPNFNTTSTTDVITKQGHIIKDSTIESKNDVDDHDHDVVVTTTAKFDRSSQLDEQEQEFISPTADEAFDRIDVDNSGSLDRDELIQALNLAASASFEDVNDDSKAIIEDLANDLVELYDVNGDGVVDRKEYKSMVADMAELRRKQIEMEYQDELKQQQKKINDQSQGSTSNNNPFLGAITSAWHRITGTSNDNITLKNSSDETLVAQDAHQVQVVNSIDTSDPVTKTLGSLTITDIKMDLRRLFFGAVPFLKHITPGGPLILEPFTVTVNGSFNRHDIMNSVLLDAGLRRLVMRVLRIRVGFIRDFIEGSVFYGRSWRMFGEAGPKIEVPQLTEIEFDENNKLIITGRAKVRTSPNAPVVEQAFKVRTRIGTGQNGRFIRLEEPELALVIECPKSWEKNFKVVSDALNIRRPLRPKPIYSFFPIYSPFKLNDDSGFDLGEDNKIRSLYIQNGALCFEMTSVLRPGRFLGSHYIAFSVPSRTFIVTLDRVKEGIRAARKTKKAAQMLLRQTRHSRRARRRRRINRSRDDDNADAIVTKQIRTTTTTPPSSLQPPKTRGFFSRFVDGYLQAEREDAKKEQITGAIRDFFGRQGAKLTQIDDNIQ